MGATEEFNMIHPPDVVGKYAPDAIIGQLGTGGGSGPSGSEAPAGSGEASQAGGLQQPLLAKTKKGDNHKREENRKKRMAEEGKIGGWIGAIIYMVLGFMKELIFTIFPQKNIAFTNDRIGLTRSAMFLFIFIIIHAIGNLHVFLGPDDFNGYGYFYVRLYWTGFGFHANIVEEYVLLCALLHVAVALKRTWDISINYTIASGKLNLVVSGLMLLTFMTIHLFQFRVGETEPYWIRPPPYLVNIASALTLNLFWTSDATVAPVAVRNIYKLEFDVFSSLGWTLFYISAVVIL